MTEATQKKLSECATILENTFDTVRGVYRICIMQHKSGDLYFMKTKDGELVELKNISSEGRKLGKRSGYGK